ncbi:nuclear transport factor 2 family protein [Robertkochia solimangrovi]|uniref:nuclear transport factor 2 family protein n=1 Tax=Robertkochia solimangrovi TaxID=2213046 RepID=UPI00117EA164|nr:nuclear transport factor 2 family protein [Robertkochia solimangrovi]TRZ45099.1 nuclear transport factor 2 family protein [Robertkochia solimangrovi]
MTHKEIAISFLKLAGTGQVDEAFESFISSNFIHHNQYFQGTREALMAAMKEAHVHSPNKSIEVKFCYEDGASVITHTHVKQELMEIAVVHIFRFEGDHIAELWDMGQPIEKESPNEYGLF